jgi:Zn finger protein HypA/HybF involved in hydrogenase expression
MDTIYYETQEYQCKICSQIRDGRYGFVIQYNQLNEEEYICPECIHL